MIDFKRTLINLHKKFPDYDLDTIIAIIDSIVETADYNRFSYGTNYPPLDTSKVTCDKLKIRNSDKEYTTEKFLV